MNRVTILGRVGKDPQVRTFQNGDKVANLSVATSERWKDKQTGEKKERTEWHTVAVTGPAVGVVESYVHKGDMILIEGQLQTRKWQDQSGQDRYSTEVVVKAFGGSVHLIPNGKPREDREQSQSDGGGGRPSSDLDDEIPF